MMFLKRRDVLLSAGASFMFRSVIARAQSTNKTPVFVHVFSPSGNYINPDNVDGSPWASKMVGGELTLGQTLSPLEAHKQDLAIINGVGFYQSADAHDFTLQLLSNHSFDTGNQVNAGGGVSCGGPTIDQVFAARASVQTRFPSLQTASFLRYGETQRYNQVISWKNRRQPLRGEENPVSLFQRLFGNVPGGPTVDPTRRRTSVLDHLSRELTTLQNKLGAEERRRVDQHATAIRETEKQLQPSAMAAACQPPSLNGHQFQTISQPSLTFPQENRLLTDLALHAVACGFTRNLVLQWVHPTPINLYMDFLGTPRAMEGRHLHDLVHARGQNAGTNTQLMTFYKYWAAEFAHVLDRLKAIPDGDTTALGNGVVLWGSEMGEGGHFTEVVPFVLAGQGGGRIKTGQYLTYPRKKYGVGNLLVTVAHGMGYPDITSYGDITPNQGPLPGILT
jgi:hypothetical protein